MKKFSKILVLLLTFSLLLGALAIFATAADDDESVASVTSGEVTENFATFGEAWQAAMSAPGSTITLLKDITFAEGEGYMQSVDVTIDLNWHTLDATKAGVKFSGHNGYPVTFYVGDVTTPAAAFERAFTIKNGNVFINPTAGYQFISNVVNTNNRDTFNYADITVTNVTIRQKTEATKPYAIYITSPRANKTYTDATKTSTLTVNNSYIRAGYPIVVGSVETVKGVEIIAKDSAFIDPTDGSSVKGSAIYTNNESYLLGGEFTNCYFYSGFRVIRTAPSASLAGLKDVTYTATDLGASFAIEAKTLGVWNFYDCTIEGKAEAIIHPWIHQMNFYGGYIYGNSNDWKLFGNNGGAATHQTYGCVSFYPYEAADGTIKYPLFSHNVKKATTRYWLQDFWDVTVTATSADTGVSMTASATEKADPNGYIVSNSGSTKYKYAYVPAADYKAGTTSVNVAPDLDLYATAASAAMLNGVGYATAAEAIEAAAADDVIILLNNVTAETSVNKPVNVLTNGFVFAPTLAEGLMIGKQSSAFSSVIEIPDDAEFHTHYYWESDTAYDESEEWDGEWETLTNEAIAAGEAPAGLLAVVHAPATSTLDYTTIANSGYDASYVDEETGEFYVHTKWLVHNPGIGYTDYIPYHTPVGAVSFIVTNDATGAVVGSGKTSADFLLSIANAANGTTIKLLDNICILSDNNAVSSSQFTLDLNGYTMYLGEGNCQKESSCTAEEHVVGKASLFRIQNTHNFTLKSSRPGGVAYNYSGALGNQFFWCTGDSSNGTINIEGENLTIYTPVVWANTGSNNTINIDGGRYITIKSYSNSWGMFQINNGSAGVSTANVKNAFFDSSYHNFIACHSTGNAFKQTANFDNCTVILSSRSSFYFARLKEEHNPTSATINLKNTTVLGTKAIESQKGVTADGDELYPTINIGAGCVFALAIKENTPYNLVDGAQLKAIEGDCYVGVTTTYGFASSGKAFKPETHTAEYLESNTKFAVYKVTYTTATESLGERYAAVNYTVDGNAFRTVYVPVLEKSAFVAPYSFSDTKNFIKSSYKTSETVTFTAVGETKTIALTATKSVDISGIKYNLNLASEISANIAIPAAVLDSFKVWVPNVGTFTKDQLQLVTIGEDKFYVVTCQNITAIQTVDTIKVKIFNAEDESLAKYVEISVAGYANKLMTKGANDVEKELGRALLVYTLEAYKALDAENTAAIEALTAYGAAAVDDETFLPEDTTALAAYFTGAFLRLESTPGIVFVANEAAYGKTFTFTYVNEKLELVNEEVTFSAENAEFELEMKVYNLDQNITIKAEGVDTVLSYNLDTYLDSLSIENNAFAQAIYRYVNAAKAYVAPVVAE